jgi:hypothetical protein
MPDNNELLEFSDITSHPLFKTEKLDGVHNAFVQRANSTLLGPFVPLRTINSDKIELDVDVPVRGGMTPMGAMGAPAPLYHIGSGRTRQSFSAPVWKEKVSFVGHELYDLRKLGTKEVLVTATEKIREKVQELEARLVRRMEWMRREFIFDKRVTGSLPDGESVTFNYTNHAGYMNVTASTPWSVLATADPADDLQLWIETFKRYSMFRPTRIILPLGTMRQLTRLEKFRDIAVNSHGSMRGTPSAIKLEIESFGNGLTLEESDHQINHVTRLLVAAAQGDTSVTVESTSMLQAGDVVEFRNVTTGVSELKTVDSVTSSSITLTSAITTVGGFPANHLVGYSKYIIPANKALILGTPRNEGYETAGNQAPLDINRINNFAVITSTIARDSDLKDPKPGIFRQTIDKTNDDPRAIYQLLGVQALPELFHGNCHMIAEIF